MRNKREQSSKKNQGTASFAGFKESDVRLLLQSLCDLLSLRNSFNVLDHSANCFGLSCTEKHCLSYQGQIHVENSFKLAGGTSYQGF